MATVGIEAAVALRRAVHPVDDAARGERGIDSALLDELGLTPAGRLRPQSMAEPDPKSSATIALLSGRSDPGER